MPGYARGGPFLATASSGEALWAGTAGRSGGCCSVRCDRGPTVAGCKPCGGAALALNGPARDRLPAELWWTTGPLFLGSDCIGSACSGKTGVLACRGLFASLRGVVGSTSGSLSGLGCAQELATAVTAATARRAVLIAMSRAQASRSGRLSPTRMGRVLPNCRVVLLSSKCGRDCPASTSPERSHSDIPAGDSCGALAPWVFAVQGRSMCWGGGVSHGQSKPPEPSPGEASEGVDSTDAVEGE